MVMQANSCSNSGVLIAHPGRQYSHQLARALQQVGLLASYYTQQPPPELIEFLPGQLRKVFLPSIVRTPPLAVSRDRIRCQFAPLVASRLLAKFTTRRLRPWADLAAWKSFDRWVAGRVSVERPGAIVGYEPS